MKYDNDWITAVERKVDGVEVKIEIIGKSRVSITFTELEELLVVG